MEAEIIKYELKFILPAGTSRGVLNTKPAWLLVLKEDSKQGIGEITRLPGLSFDDSPLFENALNSIVNLINSGHPMLETLKQAVPYPSIHFALETALLDLNTTNNCFVENNFTLGKSGIPINGLIWMGDAPFMKKQIKAKLNAGFHCLKLKIGALNIDTELDIIKEIRKDFSVSDLEIRVDANGSFSPSNAPDILEKLAKLKIHSIEQPIAVKQHEEMWNLCSKTPIPIALDEELIGVFDADNKRSLLNAIKPQYIILKPGLLGGFSASESWIYEAKKLNIDYWITSSLESNIGLSAIAQWTSTLPIKIHQGLGTGSLYSNNIPSPLKIRGESLWFNRNIAFDYSILNFEKAKNK